MSLPHRSFWEDELYDQKYDLIVTGGGLTGLSAAYFFKKEYNDAKVLVVERGTFPIGASTRNAGFACIGSIGEIMADLEIESEEIVKQRIKDRYEGLLLLRETLGDDLIEYDNCGGFEIFTNSDEFIRLQDHVPMLNEWLEGLTGEKDVFRVWTYLGIPAFFNRVEGQLHPGKMIKLLLQKCIECGVEFRWNTKVNEIDTEENKILSDLGHSFKADRLIISVNAFTSELMPEYKIKPGRGYVFVTNELDYMNWKGTFHYEKGYVYFRNIGEDRMLIGGGRNVAHTEEETAEFGVNQNIKDYLITFAKEVLELPPNWQIEREWSGIMGFTDSKSYILKLIGDNCVIAAGLSGMGVALGMNLGKKATELV